MPSESAVCWVVLKRTPETRVSRSVWVTQGVYDDKQSADLKAASYGVSLLNNLPFGAVKELPYITKEVSDA